ncbi:MAG: hypothetical protein ACI9HB_002578, partial [Gammaproteobacteria bacterium]
GRDFVQMNQLAAQITASMPIRILVPGSISVAKGLAVIEGLLDRDAKDQRLEFHILGGHNFTKERRGLHFHGSYRRDDFAAHVAQIAPHVGAVFSIWNETYCHTLTEMWAVGLPVMGSDYPTVADRIKTADAGWVYDDGDLDKLYTQILHDVDNAKGVAARQQAVMAWQLGEGRANTTRAMASKYHALYQAVWQNHKTVDDPNADPIDIYSTQSRRVAVLCHLDDAGKRVRFCTKNSPDRRLTYLPMTAAELVAAVGIGDIDKAILQVGAIADEDWEILSLFVANGTLTCLVDIDEDEAADFAVNGRSSDIRKAAVVTTPTQMIADELSVFHRHVEAFPASILKQGLRGDISQHDLDDMVVKYFGISL